MRLPNILKMKNKGLYIIGGIIIILLVILIFSNFSNTNKSSSTNINNIPLTESDNIQVEVMDVEYELDKIMSFTYDCDWVAGGNTIKCQGTVGNTGEGVIIKANNGPVMVVQDSEGCSLDCSDRENLGEISSGQRVDYTLSCSLPKKQDVKIVLSPAGGILVSSC